MMTIESIEIGDRVEIEPGIEGTVICIPKKNLFTVKHTEEDWQAENGDIVIETTNGAFVQIDLDYPHLKFIGKPKST